MGKDVTAQEIWSRSEGAHGKDGEPRPFRAWLDQHVAGASPQVQEQWTKFMTWIATTSSAPRDKKAAMRALRWFETSDTLLLARDVLDMLIAGNEHATYAHNTFEAAMSGYLTYVLADKQADDDLRTVFGRLLRCNLGLALRVNRYLSWRDGAPRGSILAQEIAAVTDSDPRFTQASGWRAAEASGLAAARLVNRLYGWSIIFTLRDLRQASPFPPKPPAAVMPTVQVMFEYPNDRWRLHLGGVVAEDPESGLRWDSDNGGKGGKWPPARPSTAPGGWPGMTGPEDVPKTLRWIEERFGAGFNRDDPFSLPQTMRKPVTLWLKT